MRKKQSAARSPRNPYGGGPGTGITLPPYYKPTPSLKNNNTYFPGSEQLDPDEMRITFLGTSPFPPTLRQAGTCIMVELGNGKKFFFDFGPGCMRNIVAMQVPLQTVNDIFISHLHVDHYADLPYLYAFAAWMGRWKPLRVHGPSGRTPKDGTKAMVEGMKQMLHWHTDSFNSFPIGDGYEVDVNEFDFRDENGICYQQDGVTVRHWQRSHTKDGASGYRLDWNGLSFVWTGDGRPDRVTPKYTQGVDVFVTEMQPDCGNLTTLKFGTPQIMTNLTIDTSHTPHYALGYMIKQVNPRLGMATHMAYDDELVPEILAGVRLHWDGLFEFGAPDGVVVNVTKDAIWIRSAGVPDSANPARPSKIDAIELFDLNPRQLTIKFPNPKHTVASRLSKSVRDREYDPRLYYPSDVFRKPAREWPKNFRVDLRQMIQEKVEEKFENLVAKVESSILKGETTPLDILRLLQTAKSKLDTTGIKPGGARRKIQQLLATLSPSQPIKKRVTSTKKARKPAQPRGKKTGPKPRRR